MPSIICWFDFSLICDLCDFVTDTDVIPGRKTDHSAISFAFGKTEPVNGLGIWGINDSLLDDEQCLYLESLMS